MHTARQAFLGDRLWNDYRPSQFYETFIALTIFLDPRGFQNQKEPE
jgi:hypothetical protein